MAYIDGQYKDSESYINEGTRYYNPEPRDFGDYGYKGSESYINEGTRYYNPEPRDFGDYGYKSSESYINEGIYASYGGPTINDKKPEELIEMGLLTPQNITEEQQKIVYDDILLGLTNNKNLLAKKIDLIISNDNLINSLLQIQYNLAINEMEKDYRRGYHDSVQDRKFQFLTTTKMLIEKGYDIDKLKFEKNKDTNLVKLLAKFKNNCDKYHSKNMPNASWFKDGKAPEGYDMKRTTSPFLFSGMLISEIYIKDPKKFEEEHIRFKENSNLQINKNASFEEFMYRVYGISLPIRFDYLNKFIEERKKQMTQDQIERNNSILNTIEEEKKSGRGL